MYKLLISWRYLRTRYIALAPSRVDRASSNRSITES